MASKETVKKTKKGGSTEQVADKNEDKADNNDMDVDEEPSYRPPSLPEPDVPLVESYTYITPIPTAPGPYVLGVDEAGRGPALGPLVYGVAFCPISFEANELEEMGFDDSKVLDYDVREELLEKLHSDPVNFGWGVRVISPQDISHGMLKKPMINLNRQSELATVHLISTILAQNPQLVISKLVVDTLGKPEKYQAYLKGVFPQIDEVRVETKADAKYKIVGAASVVAKVTRDAWIDEWVFAEKLPKDSKEEWSREFGSGYPSDPTTREWLTKNMDKTFGYPGIARFSWGPVKTACDTKGHKVLWIDDEQKSLVKSFQSITGVDKGRSFVTKELNLRSVESF